MFAIQVSLSTAHKEIYKQCLDTDHTGESPLGVSSSLSQTQIGPP